VSAKARRGLTVAERARLARPDFTATVTAGTSLIGRTVSYHGPRTDHHGVYTVVGFCRCDRCEEAFERRQDLAIGAGWGPQRRITCILQNDTARLCCVSEPTIAVLASVVPGEVRAGA
jgi:hypothetical protein